MHWIALCPDWNSSSLICKTRIWCLYLNVRWSFCNTLYMSTLYMTLHIHSYATINYHLNVLFIDAPSPLTRIILVGYLSTLLGYIGWGNLNKVGGFMAWIQQSKRQKFPIQLKFGSFQQLHFSLLYPLHTQTGFDVSLGCWKNHVWLSFNHLTQTVTIAERQIILLHRLIIYLAGQFQTSKSVKALNKI